jgi:sugar phosphate isomerase/epimerase
VGYKEVEFAGLFDNEPRKVAKILSKTGLTSPSSHIGLDRLMTKLPGVVDEAQILKNEYVVCPSLGGGVPKDAAGWRRVAADLNRIGDSLQRVGLKFAFHNHDVEFRPLPSGEIGYDVLLAECDPKYVRMELDLYWIAKAGQDAVAYFAKAPGRFPLVHVKDMAGNGAMANVGQGHIDWGRIFAKRRDAGIEHFFVERDDAKSMNDVKVSYDYLARLGL